MALDFPDACLRVLFTYSSNWEGCERASGTGMTCEIDCSTRSKRSHAPGFGWICRLQTLLGAPGIATSNKKLLGAPGRTTRSKDATRSSWPYY